VELAFEDHYAAIYARGAGGPPSCLIEKARSRSSGNVFRASRLERFGEAFLLRASPLVLLGDVQELRQLFLDTVHLLRTGQVPLEDLCVLATLHKSPPQYRRGGLREEPYEVLLGGRGAIVADWPADPLLSAARWGAATAPGGRPRSRPAEADPDYYVQRLRAVYCAQFTQAFPPRRFRQDFSSCQPRPAPPEEPDGQVDLAQVRPIAEAVL